MILPTFGGLGKPFSSNLEQPMYLALENWYLYRFKVFKALQPRTFASRAL